MGTVIESFEVSISLALFWKKQNISTKRSLYEICNPACPYKTLVVNVNRWCPLALAVLTTLLKLNRIRTHPVKHTDSTDIPVCLNKNARCHKTMKAYAAGAITGKARFLG